MNDAFKSSVVVLARVLLALMFVLSGFGKLADLSGTAGYIASAGLPVAPVLAVIVAVLEVLGGLALIVGFQARSAAWALALFTVAATVLFHNFWAMPVEQQFLQKLMFMKNLAVAGGLFFVAAMGAGPASIDARRATA